MERAIEYFKEPPYEWRFFYPPSQKTAAVRPGMNTSFLLRPSPTVVGFGRRRPADFAPPPSNVAGTFDVPPKEEKSSTLSGSDLEGIPRALARGASFL